MYVYMYVCMHACMFYIYNRIYLKCGNLVVAPAIGPGGDRIAPRNPRRGAPRRCGQGDQPNVDI